MEIPPLSHCLSDVADGHTLAQQWRLLNSNANRFTMGACPSLHFPTREKSCVLGRNWGGLDHSYSVFRLHIPASSGKHLVMDDDLGPQGKRAWSLCWGSAAGSEVCSPPLKQDQGYSFSTLLINICKICWNHPMQGGIADITVYNVSVIPPLFLIPQAQRSGCLL